MTMLKSQRIINLILFLLPVLALLFIFRKVIFFGELFFNGDSILQFYHYFRLAGEQAFLVVPDMLGGFPLYASVGVGWFYPIGVYLAKVLGYIDGYNFLTLLNFILAYLFTFLYARKINLSQAISIFIATIFTFSAHLFVWGSLLVNSNYYFVLPAVLWLSEYLKPNPINFRSTLKQIIISLLIGTILGASWLSSHSQFVVYIHAFLAAYFIFLVWQKPTIKNIVRKLIYLLISYSVSIIVGWLQISTTLGMREITSRSGGTSLAENFSSTYLPQDIIHYFLPLWSNPVIETGSSTIYIGILPLILLITALISWKKLKENKYFVFFLITFVGSLLLSITNSPLAMLLHKLPLFDSFRGAQRIMFVGNFGAAVVIGLTLNQIIHHQQEVLDKLSSTLKWFKRFFLYIIVPLILLATIARVFFFDKILKLIENYFLTNVYPNTTKLPQEHYINLINNYLTDTFDQAYIGNWQIITLLLFSILAYLLLKSISKIYGKKLLIFAILITVFNFSFVYANFYKTVPREIFTSQSPTAEFIKQHSSDQEPYRIFSLFSGMTEYNELVVKCPNSNEEDKLILQQALLMPNLNLLYNLESPDGYDNFMTARLAKVLAYAGSDRSITGDLLAEESSHINERLDKFIARKNLLRAMNVQYVISHFELDDEDFELLNNHTVGSCLTEVNIYELVDSWPRYYLTNNVSIVNEASFNEVINVLQSDTQQGKVVIEKDIDIEKIVDLEQEYLPVRAKWEGDVIRLEVESDKDSLLYLSNTWLPGWQATIDGESVEILKANYAFMAVMVPQGEHDVTFIYTK